MFLSRYIKSSTPSDSVFTYTFVCTYFFKITFFEGLRGKIQAYATSAYKCKQGFEFKRKKNSLKNNPTNDSNE